MDKLKYDFHIHTNFSHCSTFKPELLLELAKKKGFNGIAVTDHFTIRGGEYTKKINKDKDFEVIVGTEIETPKGSILGYYLNSEIKSREIPEIIDEIRSQGGLCVIAHPFRFSLFGSNRLRIPIEKLKGKVDAIEAINSRNLPGSNLRATQLAEKMNITKIAGTDAHFPFEFGRAYTLIEGDMEYALKKNKTEIHGDILLGPFGGFLSLMRNSFFRKKNNKI